MLGVFTTGIVRTDTIGGTDALSGMCEKGAGILTMLPSGFVVGTVAGSGMFVAMLQMSLDDTFLTKISAVGATGILAVAVIVLWRKLVETQGQLMTLYKEGADEAAARRAALEKMVETLSTIKDVVIAPHRK